MFRIRAFKLQSTRKESLNLLNRFVQIISSLQSDNTPKKILFGSNLVLADPCYQLSNTA